MEPLKPIEQNPNNVLHFQQQVVIDGKQFVFEGDVPENPADFDWFVTIPNYEHDLGPKVEAMLTQLEAQPVMGDVNPRYVRGLESYNLGEGRVGVIQVVGVTPIDGAPSIGIKYVQTETSYFPDDSGYRDTKGLGSFLLDNLCTLADIKKWRIYVFPDDRGGGLDQAQLYEWYQRKGFEDDYKFPKESRDSFGGMQRWPREQDRSQVIATILQTAPDAK